MSKLSNWPPPASATRPLHFGEFSVGVDLRRHGAPVDITPKAFAVLRLLVERSGELVTRDELWSTVWPRVIVTDAALTMCMAELRRVLGDDARRPRFIATVPKRGYRFLVPVHDHGGDAGIGPLTGAQASQPSRLVGRAEELVALREALDAARQGQRRIVFVVGEPGIGKTSLLEAFADELEQAPRVRVVRGQCSEHFGPSEPYLPLFDGIGRACGATGGEALFAALVRHAPLWVAQLPSLADRLDREALSQRLSYASPERMMRELAEALEAYAADAPLVLYLEDLHWSDRATLDWLAFVARRVAATQLLIVGTLRDTTTLRSGHPLRDLVASLAVHPQCRNVAVSRLEPGSVRSYLERRAGELTRGAAEAELAALSRVLHARTDGNPLFLTNVLDDALAHIERRPAPPSTTTLLAALMQRPIPDNLAQFIVHQLDQLSDAERALLEAAAVVGEQVAPALIASVLEIEEQNAEALCEALARETRLLQSAGLLHWPDGTVSSRYVFKHSVYRELLYSRIPAGRVARTHKAIADRLERAHGERAKDIAGELAVHYGRSHSPVIAARWYLQAGRNALACAAYADAEAQFRQGLLQIKEAAESGMEIEFALQIALGNTLIALRGWASTSAEEAFARAYHLRSSDGEVARFTPLWGLAMGTVVRADFARYRNLGRELLALANATGRPLPLACARWATAQHYFHVGEFESADTWFNHAFDGFDAIESATQIELLGNDFGVFSLCYRMHVAWILGDSERAASAYEAALERAIVHRSPFSLVLVHAYATLFRLFSDDSEAAAKAAETVVDLSRERGFGYYRGWGEFVLGVVEADAGLAEQHMLQGLAVMESSGARLRRAYYLALLAERRGQAGNHAAARSAMDAANREFSATRERCWEAEILRIDGTLYGSAGDIAAAQSCFERAVAAARKQRACAFERRSLAAFADFLAQNGRSSEIGVLLGGDVRA